MQKASAGQLEHKIAMRSLRAKVTISLLLPLIIILSIFMYLQIRNQQRILLQNMALLASQTGLTIENSLEKAMLTHNQEELQQILDSVGKNDMLEVVYLLDTSGKVVFAPEGRGIGARLSNRDLTCQPCHNLPPEKRPASIVVTLPAGQRIFRTMIPIRNAPECQSCHSKSEKLNGVLLTDISMVSFESSLREDLLIHLAWLAASILVSVALVNLVVDRFVLRRLEAISAAITRLGLGQAGSPLPENQADEIGQVSLAFNEMARQIESRESENRQLSEDLQRQSTLRGELLKRLAAAQEDERKRVARELHDELGQSLAGLALRTEAVSKLIRTNPEQAREVLNETQTLINATSEQMYNLILALRPSALDDLGLVSALRTHASRVLKDTGIAFHLDASGLSKRLPAELETVLYRIFQEALNNIVRHASASRVEITLALKDGSFQATIVDNGQGFDPSVVQVGAEGAPPGQGLGLLGMQERIAQYNGQLEILSEEGFGTRIHILIPL